MNKIKNKPHKFPLSLLPSPTIFPFPFSLLTAIIFIPIFLTMACTTSPQTGDLTGTIQLSGEEEHSGIIVALYDLVELDTTITRINNEYPHIGIKITQHTEFDHRFANLTKYSQTDANGNFKIKNIPTGRYNFMAMKEGFGFKYIYEVTITDGDNSLPAPATAYTLFPVTHISSNIDTSNTWETDHHYVIEGDIIVSGSLTIETCAIIRLNEGVKLTISGDLIAIGEKENMIWFTSNDSLRFPSSILPSPYKSVELTGSLNKQVSYSKFDHAGTGLLNKVNGFSISNCIFRNSSCGFKSENVDSTFCSNLLCKAITNESEAGIYFNQVAEGCIEKNSITNCENGVKIKTYSNPKVKNNYIDNCNRVGIDVLYYSSPDIHNNEIIFCEIGLWVYRESYPLIEKNIFNDIICIKVYLYNNPLEVHYNNLFGVDFAIKIRPDDIYHSDDINAQHNFFNTTNEEEIQELIYDKYDVDESIQDNVGIVFYNPFLTQEYPYAGIQEE